jgi:ADP-ribose pyrophosphatase
MKQLLQVKKQTNNKHLNLFLAHYQTKQGEFIYEFASRKQQLSAIACNNKQNKADAVRMIPYMIKEGKIIVVLIKEFRHALNQYLLGVPAGLIDEGEDEYTAAKRELLEEIGATVVALEKTEAASFTSAGMSDESVICFEAQVELLQKQQLESTEDITIKLVELEQLPSLLDTEPFGMQSRLQLRAFYYKQKLNELQK